MLKEIDTYLDILSGERDFPEIGNECLETCPPDCEEHKWYCVYWLRLAPEVAYSDYYYDYALRSIVNNADVYTDGYVGVSRRLEGRYKEHRYRDTRYNRALLKELIEWYGDNIQLLILEEGLSKTKAYEVEGFYRPYPNIGWNKAKGGRVPTIAGEARRKLKYRHVHQPSTGKQTTVPLAKLESFLEENPTWIKGSLQTPPDPRVVYILQKGDELEAKTCEDWVNFFNIARSTFYAYINSKYTIEINGKSYSATKQSKRQRQYIQLVVNINHPIHDWKVIKKEKLRNYDKRNNN